MAERDRVYAVIKAKYAHRLTAPCGRYTPAGAAERPRERPSTTHRHSLIPPSLRPKAAG